MSVCCTTVRVTPMCKPCVSWENCGRRAFCEFLYMLPVHMEKTAVINTKETLTNVRPICNSFCSQLICYLYSKPWLYNDFIYSFTAEGKKWRKCSDYVHSMSEQIITKRMEALVDDSCNTSFFRTYFAVCYMLLYGNINPE